VTCKVAPHTSKNVGYYKGDSNTHDNNNITAEEYPSNTVIFEVQHFPIAMTREL
jgi:hypothetical protein